MNLIRFVKIKMCRRFIALMTFSYRKFELEIELKTTQKTY